MSKLYFKIYFETNNDKAYFNLYTDVIKHMFQIPEKRMGNEWDSTSVISIDFKKAYDSRQK
jgi:hypothetical protein